MVTANGVKLQIDPQKRIGVADVIDMLKGLRNEAVIKIVRTSDSIQKQDDFDISKSFISTRKTFLRSSAVTGNTNLPQIRELNEIAALLRSIDTQQNQFGS